MKTVTVTPNDFLCRLEQRVTQYDARLILRSAMIVSGVKDDLHHELSKEKAKDLCLALINRGGPAYQVGSSVYKEVLQ